MYTIKDVSKQLKISLGSLKNWEKLFAEFLQISRTKNGSRIYGNSELIILKKIKLMKDKNLSDDMVKFILETNNEETHEVPLEIKSEYDLKYDDIVALQEETVQAVKEMSESFNQMKNDFIQEVKKEVTSEVKKEVTSEVKKEITKGNAINENIIQTYSHEIVDTYKITYEQISNLKQEIEKEQEEKLFLQKKIEEREELFQDFVQSYRQAAAAIEAKNEKRTFSYWIDLLAKKRLKWTKM